MHRWQLPYTWPGFVWVHIVIIDCHVAYSRKECSPVLIVLLKSADKTESQAGQLQASSHAGSIFLFHSLREFPVSASYAVRAQWVHLLYSEMYNSLNW